MKKTIILFSVAYSTILLGQNDDTRGYVGINTENPKATLDINGWANDTNRFDGIIPPRLTAKQLASKNYTTKQEGAVVYITSVNETFTNPQSKFVDSSGLYFFNGNVWNKFIHNESSYYFPLAGNSKMNPISGDMYIDNRNNYSFSILGNSDRSIPKISWFDDGVIQINYNSGSNVYIKNIDFNDEGILCVECIELPFKENDTYNKFPNYFTQKKYVDKLIESRVPTPPSNGNYILKSLNGKIQWVEDL